MPPSTAPASPSGPSPRTYSPTASALPPLDGLRGKILHLAGLLLRQDRIAAPMARIDGALAGPILRGVVPNVFGLLTGSKDLPLAFAILLAPDTPSPRALAAIHAQLAGVSEADARAALSALSDLLTQWLIEDDEARAEEAEAVDIDAYIHAERARERAARELLGTTLHDDARPIAPDPIGPDQDGAAERPGPAA